ncbi:hypothetical protein [Mesorhizobium sp.]|uniref:hypothetical protein n=1 Tax=Mesorhizobium sp. TaxID=1871066 RepID=UPI0025C03527|nr:hypothetical protein [Mesorhizobium sp.]
MFIQRPYSFAERPSDRICMERASTTSVLPRSGMKAAERATRVDRMLERFHLTDFGGRMPSQLSGGQQQRVPRLHAR